MTNTEQLSGLSLRIAVAKKLGYRMALSETDAPKLCLLDPSGEIVTDDVGSTFGATWEKEEWVWQNTCPAFESDLGALQSSGVIEATLLNKLVLLDCQHEDMPPSARFEQYILDGPGGELVTQREAGGVAGLPSEALAVMFCRAYL